MVKQQLLLLSAVFLVLGQSLDDDSDSTRPQLHQQEWHESEREIPAGTREIDSIPSESQDTRSNFQEHPNNGPLIEQERPRQRNRSRSNGKRRRRMRKRPRTTTLEPFVDDIVEQPQPTDEEAMLQRPRFQSERIYEEHIQEGLTATDEESKPKQRRRTGKRRRPHHRRPPRIEERYEEIPDEPTTKPEVIEERAPVQGRKRRKGTGRKRTRVETEPPPIIDDEPRSQLPLTERIPEDIVKEQPTKKENEPKEGAEIKENLATTTELIIQTTIPTKRQNNNFKLSSIKPTVKTNRDTQFVSLQSDEDQQSSQSSENHNTEIHYSTTYSTRQTSDQNSQSRYLPGSTIDTTKITRATTESTREIPIETTKLISSRYATNHKQHTRKNNFGDTLKIQNTTEQPNVEYNTENIPKVEPLNEQPEVTINRKTLFSNQSTRRLPPTSAIIRRKLKEKSNITNSISTDNENIQTTTITSTHLNTEKKTLQNAQDKIIRGLAYRNEIEPSTLLPQGFKTNPEILSPMKLLEEVTINEVLKMMTSTTERSRHDDNEEDNRHTTIKMSDYKDNSDRLNLDGVELPNIRDEILDLIKSESGISRVARILELRNMTLKELLDHRERGSSQLHFSENLNKKPDFSKTMTTVQTSSQKILSTTEPTTMKIITTPLITTRLFTPESTVIIPKTIKPLSTRKLKPIKTTSTTTRENIILSDTILEGAETTFDIESREKPTLKVEASVMSVPILEPTHTSNIQFPEQGILGSFPKFLVDTLQHEETLKIQKNQKSETKLSSSTPKPQLFTFKTETNDNTDKREPRLFDSMPEFSSNRTELKSANKQNKSTVINWKSQFNIDNVKPFRGEHKELIIAITSTGRPKPIDVDDVVLFNEKDDQPRNNVAGKISAETEGNITDEDYFETSRLPPGVKSAILASGAILGLAILGFLTVLVSCRLRQRNARMRGRRDILCEQLQEDFRSSQCSLSPVLSKSHRAPVFGQGIHSNTSSNRHYYLWRTLRKTFQYE